LSCFLREGSEAVVVAAPVEVPETTPRAHHFEQAGFRALLK
jgi:hypothetical protein